MCTQSNIIQNLCSYIFSSCDVANMFIKQPISNNSLSLLSNVSGWFQLLLNSNKELNIQHRFINNLYHSLDQSIQIVYYLTIILHCILYCKIVIVFFSNEIILTPSKKQSFLQEILDFEKFAQQGLTAVNKFIFKYLLSWDGMEFARVIYELFEYLSFNSEEGGILKKQH